MLFVSRLAFFILCYHTCMVAHIHYELTFFIDVLYDLTVAGLVRILRNTILVD